MRIEFIVTMNGFNALHEEWDNLLENSLNDNPFLSYSWLHTWWEVYGHGELYIITCRDSVSGELLGILPLFRFRTGLLLSATILRFMGSERVSSDFLECIARHGREDEVYAACIDALQRDVSKWDVVELQDMDEHSPFSRFLTGAGIPGMEMMLSCFFS